MTTARRSVVVVVVVAMIAAAAGVCAGLLVRHTGPSFPEISVYSHGRAERVGPYTYCNVINLNDCQNPRTQGELRVTERNPVQLSVPEAISQAPWRLLRVYQDPRDSTDTLYRPNTRTAVTIPTVDPHRGRLMGFAVQLSTLVMNQAGELGEVPHAEWSVRLVWP